MKIVRKYGDFIKENAFTHAPQHDLTSNPSMGGPQTDTKSKCHDLSGEVELYRLTSHPVVDLSEPGEYYVSDLNAVSPELLDNPHSGEELFVITVKTDSSNIDCDRSDQTCQEKSCDSCICVVDDSKCKIVDVKPFEN